MLYMCVMTQIKGTLYAPMRFSRAPLVISATSQVADFTTHVALRGLLRTFVCVCLCVCVFACVCVYVCVCV